MSHLNRRQFLASAGTVSAITILKPSIVFGSAANSAIRLGIIGCGNRGTAVLSNMVRHTPAQLVAMADLFDYQLNKARPVFNDLNKEKDFGAVPGKNIYQGSKAYLELLENPDIDAVLISSPAYTHPGFLEAAVMAGKHVYCEKPVAPDVAGCRKVIEAGSKAEGKVSVAIGFQIRHATPYVEMRKRILRGDIGEVINVQLYYISSAGSKVEPVGRSREEFMIRNHFHFMELSGGILLDQGIHMLDICNWVLHERPLEAIGKANRKGEMDFGDIFTNYQVIYDYPEERSVSLHSTRLGPAFNDVCCRFMGTKGVAEAHYSRGVYIKGENPWDSGILWGQAPDPAQVAAGAFTSSLHDSTPNKVRAFIQSIESGALINEAWSGASSTLSAILGRRTAMSGAKADWNEMYYSGQQLSPDLNLKQFDS